jgi:putative endonuclease
MTIPTVSGGSGQLGRIGEQLAARHLEQRGMRILDRNWRCRVEDLRGEIDLVALDGTTIVICEVKTRRRATAAGPLEGVTPAKLARLRRLAAAWMADHDAARETRGHVGEVRVRIDAVGVHWPARGGAAVVTHLEGIDA